MKHLLVLFSVVLGCLWYDLFVYTDPDASLIFFITFCFGYFVSIINGKWG